MHDHGSLLVAPRRKDPRTRGWKTLQWKMTEEYALEWALKNGREIEKVEGSESPKRKPGSPFSPRDLLHLGRRGAVDDTLLRLVKERAVKRIG